MGSSTVMMCSWRVRLARSTSAARVVDLPDPVGPVTSTKPRGSDAKFPITGGMPSCSMLLISKGITRKAAPRALRWRNRFTRNRATPVSA